MPTDASQSSQGLSKEMVLFCDWLTANVYFNEPNYYLCVSFDKDIALGTVNETYQFWLKSCNTKEEGR
jgi:hypothetical protein